MAPTERPVVHKVLLVDDDGAILAMMTQTLERKGFAVVAAASVTELWGASRLRALMCSSPTCTCPDPGHGFTVVTAVHMLNTLPLS